MGGGKDFRADLGAMARLLARDFLTSEIVLLDAGVLAVAAFDEMLVGESRQRLAALVAHLVRIGLGGQHWAKSEAMPLPVAIGEDLGVAFVDADLAQAARPRHTCRGF